MPAPGTKRIAEKVALAKETLAEAGRYVDSGDAEKAAWLIQEAERIVLEIVKGKAGKHSEKVD